MSLKYLIYLEKTQLIDVRIQKATEQVHDNVFEGGNFLASVSLMAKYDEFLVEVISLPGRAKKCIRNKIQSELIHLLANTVPSTLVDNVSFPPI